MAPCSFIARSHLAATCRIAIACVVLGACNRLQSLSINPPDASLSQTETLQLMAIATFSNGDVRDVTAASSWSSAAPKVLTINDAGVATGLAEGSGGVEARYEGKTASETVVVNKPPLKSLVVFITRPRAIEGDSQDLRAVGTDVLGHPREVTLEAQWSVSDPKVLELSSGPPRLTARAPGKTRVKAAVGIIEGSSDLEVARGCASSDLTRFEPPMGELLSHEQPDGRLARVQFVWRTTASRDAAIRLLTASTQAHGFRLDEIAPVGTGIFQFALSCVPGSAAPADVDPMTTAQLELEAMVVEAGVNLGDPLTRTLTSALSGPYVLAAMTGNSAQKKDNRALLQGTLLPYLAAHDSNKLALGLAVSGAFLVASEANKIPAAVQKRVAGLRASAAAEHKVAGADRLLQAMSEATTRAGMQGAVQDKARELTRLFAAVPKEAPTARASPELPPRRPGELSQIHQGFSIRVNEYGTKVVTVFQYGAKDGAKAQDANVAFGLLAQRVANGEVEIDQVVSSIGSLMSPIEDWVTNRGDASRSIAAANDAVAAAKRLNGKGR